MRLKLQDLTTHLQRGLAPLYFIVGEEPQQQLEALHKIRTEAYARGYGQRERYDISPQFDWESFKNKLAELSLFSEKRFIEGRLTGNIGKLGARIIVEIANNPPPDTLLLFSSDKLDSAVAKSAWFTSVERLGVTLWSRPLSNLELRIWIKKRLKEVSLHLSEDAIDTLSERTEGNLLATDQAIEKLLLYSYSLDGKASAIPMDLDEPIERKNPENPEKIRTLPSEAVSAIAGVDTQFSLFDLVDAALAGDIHRTKHIFARLRSEGIEPILILWAITREARAIIPLARAIEKGSSLSQGFREHNVWKHKVSLYTSFLNRTAGTNASTLAFLHQFMIQAKDIDNILKGRKQGDAGSALFLLCLSLAGVAYVSAQS